MLARILNWLLGPKCPRCRARVLPTDTSRHALDCS